MVNNFIKGILLCMVFTLLTLTIPANSASQDVGVYESIYNYELKSLSYLLRGPIDRTGYDIYSTPGEPDDLILQETIKNDSDRNTTSLTFGYIDDEFLLETDQGSNRFYFQGETAGAMISGKKANLMFAYGSADASDSDGEIRSLSADLSFGGNVYIIRSFLRLPISIYVPIRLNAGYRNLSMVAEEDVLHLAKAGIGAGAGASVRIPTGLPLLHDNLTGLASLVRNVGGMGEISSTLSGQVGTSDENALSGILLTQNTDLNIEVKFENLIANSTGVTVGITIRWQSWTEEKFDEFLQVLNVVTGQHENLSIRGKQTFLRLGINW